MFIMLLCTGINANASPKKNIAAVPAKVQLEQLIKYLADKPEYQQVEGVNEFFNKIPRVRDRAVWGKNDYWATPNELMSLLKGDCEDLAIAKYFVLRKLGISEQKINLAYGKSFDSATGILEPHMVLIYYADNTNLVILDSLKTSLTSLVKRYDLVLEYSFNTEWLWRIQDGQKGQLVGRAENISKWNILLKRM